jgi:hypothetical protein
MLFGAMAQALDERPQLFQTPGWVKQKGHGLIRRRLGLHTVRRAGVYIIPSSELPRVEQLYGK